LRRRCCLRERSARGGKKRLAGHMGRDSGDARPRESSTFLAGPRLHGAGCHAVGAMGAMSGLAVAMLPKRHADGAAEKSRSCAVLKGTSSPILRMTACNSSTCWGLFCGNFESVSSPASAVQANTL